MTSSSTEAVHLLPQDRSSRRQKDEPQSKRSRQPAEPSKQPLSLEELLAKRKAEEEALSRPKFYTKEERAQQALQKRMEEVRLQRERADIDRRKAMEEMRHSMTLDDRRGACDAAAAFAANAILLLIAADLSSVIALCRLNF